MCAMAIVGILFVLVYLFVLLQAKRRNKHLEDGEKPYPSERILFASLLITLLLSAVIGIIGRIGFTNPMDEKKWIDGFVIISHLICN